MRARAIAVVALAIAACDEKKEDSAKGEVAAGSAVRKPTGPANADALIREVTAGGSELGIATLEIDYVRSDGTMDQTYGKLSVTLLGPEPAPPPDDPSRPTGAPVPSAPVMQQRSCDERRWDPVKGWEKSTFPMCMAMGEPRAVRCTVLELWKRAIAAGAPANALARIRLMMIADEGNWTFSIDDAPRNIHFSESWRDDCPPRAEVPE